MVFGWLECVVVVYAWHVALEQGVGHLKQKAMSDPDFALGVINVYMAMPLHYTTTLHV